MTFKKLLNGLLALIFSTCSTLGLANELLDINGIFSNPVKDIPANWIMNGAYSGSIKVQERSSGNIVELNSGTKPVHIFSKFKKYAVAGDKIRISVKLKGTGNGLLGIYLYSSRGAGSEIREFKAGSEWKMEEAFFELKDFRGEKSGFIRIVVGAAKSSSVSFSDLKAEIVKNSETPAPEPTASVSTANVVSGPSLASTSNQSPAPAPEQLQLTIPKEFYGVSGIENAIYVDNIILTQRPGDYTIKVEPQIGKTKSGCWSIVPVENQKGQHTLAVSVVDNRKNKTVIHGRINLCIASMDAGKGKKLSILVVGDSLTAAAKYPAELARLLKQGGTECLMLGSQKKQGVAFEGYGGWTWGTFINYKTSPFVFVGQDGKSKLDLSRYFKEKCAGVTPDVITVLLGINDCFSVQKQVSDISAVKARIDGMFKNAEILIGEFKAAAPNALIGICLVPPPNAREEAFFANYKGKFKRWPWKQVQHILVQRQIKYFGDRENENIYIIPTELNIDSVNGYPVDNGVHPNSNGYNQIAASIYCWLKWQLHTNVTIKH